MITDEQFKLAIQRANNKEVVQECQSQCNSN